MTTETDEQEKGARRPWRQRLRIPLMLLGIAGFAVTAVAMYLAGGRYQETDDAYVQAARVAVSANVAGRVQEIDVRDNQAVHEGDVLFRLDDAPFRIAIEEAQAELAAARLQVETLRATWRQRQSELVRARDTADYQQREYDRERRLIASGISSQAEVDRAAHALDDARTRVEAAAQQVSAAAAALGGNPNIAPDRHPAVQQAQARLDRARLDLSYTVVRAPADGVVSHVEQLQVGNHIAASAPAFALVVVGDLWIEANFKEDQLTHMHAGQVATVEVDSYPGRRFEARVASVSPGTGSQFSALPPENATGNWVKVVQRLPVRVELFHPDPAYPLYAGLSATVSVDTKHERHLFASAQADGRVPH